MFGIEINSLMFLLEEFSIRQGLSINRSIKTEHQQNQLFSVSAIAHCLYFKISLLVQVIVFAMQHYSVLT